MIEQRSRTTLPPGWVNPRTYVNGRFREDFAPSVTDEQIAAIWSGTPFVVLEEEWEVNTRTVRKVQLRSLDPGHGPGATCSGGEHWTGVSYEPRRRQQEVLTGPEKADG